MEIAYCIQEPNGKTLRINTIDYIKKDCIGNFILVSDPYGMANSKITPWSEWYKYGWRCVKVEVKILLKKPKK